MSPNERRQNRPERGRNASRDGKKFEKRNSSDPSKRSDSKDFKPRSSSFKTNHSDNYKSRFKKDDANYSSRPNRRYNDDDARSFERDSENRDNPRNSNYRNNRSDNQKGRFRKDDTNSSSRPNRKFNDDARSFEKRDNYKGRFNKDDSNYSSRPPRRYDDDSSRSSEGQYDRRQLRDFKETRFDKDKKFRPRKKDENYDPSAKYSKKKQLEHKKKFAQKGPARLNKYIANAGLCSRREADEYIKAGVVTVNGIVVTEMGSKVMPGDKVLFHDQLVQSEKKVYILLNKPKDCVTTTDDPNARLTVMDLVKNACDERIYPVGRLDRYTTGVLLLTNDGEMASKLTHPKFEKKKIYHVFLDKALTKIDMKKIADGIELEDGPIHSDDIHYVEEEDKKQVGIEIHSGKNRIVRRIFEHLDYKVIRLDRVYFAGLTKKNLSRGKWRHLNQKEISFLRMGAYD